MRLLASLLLGAAASVTCLGCRFSEPDPPPPWDDAIEADSLLREEAECEPLPYRIGIAPVRVGFDAAELHAESQLLHAAVPDLEVLREELREGLRSLGLFARVASRGTPGDTPGQVRALAWEAQDDLLLEFDLRDYHHAYLGHANYGLWFVAYTSAVWPAFFVKVDRYGVGLELQACLRSLQERLPPLHKETYVVRPEANALELTPLDRDLVGFVDVLALWSVEASLDEGNWAEIESFVGPHARRGVGAKLLQSLVREVAQRLRTGSTEEREAVLRRLRKRLSLTVGVSEVADATLAGAAFAADDARAASETLQSEPGGSLVAGQDLTTLVDEQATKQGVVEAIRAIASRVTESDEVFLYFATRGLRYSENGSLSAALVLHDTERERLVETSLTLAELRAELEGVRAANLVLVFDTSFSGAGRSLEPTAELAQLSQQRLSETLELRPGWTALFAAQPNQGAGVLPRARGGLFSEVLLEGLSGPADSDADARVSVSELHDYVRLRVSERAGLEGFEQLPWALGVEAGRFGWPR